MILVLVTVPLQLLVILAVKLITPLAVLVIEVCAAFAEFIVTIPPGVAVHNTDAPAGKLVT